MSSPFDEAKYNALLKGLEVSVVRLSELERTSRIDSEFYKKENLNIQKLLEKSDSKPLTDFVHVSDGNHMSISDNFCEKGVPYYRGQDIHDFFIENANPICIPESVFKMPTMLRSHLQKNDVLLSIVGTIGGVSLVNTNANATCSCKLAILRPKARCNADTIALFLQSKYGQNQIKKFIRGAVQMGFILEDVNQINIPNFSTDFQQKIESLVKSAHAKLAESKSLYAQAEDTLLCELGLKDWQPKNEAVSIKSFSDFASSGRLDAEYYQSKYDEIENAVKSYKGGYDFVKNQFKQNVDVCDYSEKAYNYIEIGDINTGDGLASFNLVETDELPDNAKRVVHFGDVLISKVRPYRGAVAIINFEAENLIASGAFTTLHEKSDYKKEVLQVLLRTQIYKEWLLKWNVGSSYPVIKDEDILNLPAPLLPPKIQEQIAELIQKSFALRAESKRLLEEAKKMVEAEIEK